jgi:hypothetical protein
MSPLSTADRTALSRQNELVRGVRDGSLNRAEFRHLNSVDNEIAFQRGLETDSCGCSAGSSERLRGLQHQYSDLYQKYRHGDFQPRTEARSPQQRQVNEQADQIHSNIEFGNDRRNFPNAGEQQEHNRLLGVAIGEQRDIFRGAGQAVGRSGGWNPSIAHGFTRRLNESMANQY